MSLRKEIRKVIIEEFKRAINEGDADVNNDGVIDHAELYNHFDVDGDGVVTMSDYADHVEFHCQNPEILRPFLRSAEASMKNAPCPATYKKCANHMLQQPGEVYYMTIGDIMDTTKTDCPVSTSMALYDVLGAMHGESKCKTC